MAGRTPRLDRIAPAPIGPGAIAATAGLNALGRGISDLLDAPVEIFEAREQVKRSLLVSEATLEMNDVLGKAKKAFLLNPYSDKEDEAFNAMMMEEFTAIAGEHDHAITDLVMKKLALGKQEEAESWSQAKTFERLLGKKQDVLNLGVSSGVRDYAEISDDDARAAKLDETLSFIRAADFVAESEKPQMILNATKASHLARIENLKATNPRLLVDSAVAGEFSSLTEAETEETIRSGMALANAQAVGDLELDIRNAVADGNVELYDSLESAVDSMVLDGSIPSVKAGTRLKAMMIGSRKAASQKTEDLEFVQDHFASGSPVRFASTDSTAMRQINTYWDAIVSSVPEADQGAAASVLIDKFGFAPERAVDTFRGWVNSPDPQLVGMGVVNRRMLARRSPQDISRYTRQEDSKAIMIEGLMNAGIEIPEAIAKTEDILKPRDPAETARLNVEFKQDAKEWVDKTFDKIVEMADARGRGGFRAFFGDPNVGEGDEGQMKEEIRSTLLVNYHDQMSFERASQQTADMLGGFWDIEDFGTGSVGRTVQRNGISKFYGVPGDDDSNERLKESILTDFEIDEDSLSTLKFEIDPVTMRDEGGPSFYVWQITPDGKQFDPRSPWRPDWAEEEIKTEEELTEEGKQRALDFKRRAADAKLLHERYMYGEKTFNPGEDRRDPRAL